MFPWCEVEPIQEYIENLFVPFNIGINSFIDSDKTIDEILANLSAIYQNKSPPKNGLTKIKTWLIEKIVVGGHTGKLDARVEPPKGRPPRAPSLSHCFPRSPFSGSKQLGIFCWFIFQSLGSRPTPFLDVVLFLDSFLDSSETGLETEHSEKGTLKLVLDPIRGSKNPRRNGSCLKSSLWTGKLKNKVYAKRETSLTITKKEKKGNEKQKLFCFIFIFGLVI